MLSCPAWAALSAKRCMQHAEHGVLAVPAPRTVRPPGRAPIGSETAGRGDVGDVRRHEARDDLGGRQRRVVVPDVVLVELGGVTEQHVVQPEVRAVADVAEQAEHRPPGRQRGGSQLGVVEAVDLGGHLVTLRLDPVEDFVSRVHAWDVGARLAVLDTLRRLDDVGQRTSGRTVSTGHGASMITV